MLKSTIQTTAMLSLACLSATNAMAAVTNTAVIKPVPAKAAMVKTDVAKPGPAKADEPDAAPHSTASSEDKSNYHLFNPTPLEKMRDFSTDRPDKTESPYTVDAGHFQIEMDIATYTYDSFKSGSENTRTRGLGVAPINLKAGLTNNTDLQVVIDNYVHERASDKNAGTHESKSGFGDVTVRLKHNIWGNDGGNTAFAIMPFIKLPTNSNDMGNDAIEGGVILPWGTDLAEGVALGLMAEVDVLEDEDASGYHASYIASATIGHELTDKVGHYVELFVEESMEEGARTVVTFDTGVTYALADNVQLDAGVNIGLTKAADDINPFIGISSRF